MQNKTSSPWPTSNHLKESARSVWCDEPSSDNGGEAIVASAIAASGLSG